MKIENIRDQYKRIYTFFATLLLVVYYTVSFSIVWYTVYSDTIFLPFYRRGNWVMILIYVVLVLLFSKMFGGMKVGYLKQSDMIYSQIFSIVCVNVLTYFQISVVNRFMPSVWPMVILTLVDLVILMLWVIVSNKIYFHLYPPRRLVVIYGEHTAADLVIKMSRRVEKYMICESVRISEGIPHILSVIRRYEGVILCEVSGPIRNDLIKYCFAQNIRMYIAPKISDIIIRGAEEIRLFDTPLLLCRNYGLTIGQRFGKRCFDLIVSSVLLVIFSPLMLVSAIAIKAEDGGSILFRQKRLTQGGKEFYVCKFRSMVEDAEKHGPQLAREDDDRITKTGRILRKYRIDELPQLLNILKGEMSVVGPRPERPELAVEYEKNMPEFKFRLQVKAGLTGYAQVTGKYDTQPYDKLKMDLMYIENYSIFFDLRILLMTMKTALFPGETNEEAQIHDLERSKTEDSSHEETPKQKE
ncbi:MAG: sugar transferase [Ruminococcus sp.]|nr:sugar transferase [Ruminococcus sp.]